MTTLIREKCHLMVVAIVLRCLCIQSLAAHGIVGRVKFASSVLVAPKIFK